MKTKHRQNLPPWVKPETSNMIKRLHTAREHKLTKVAVLERELSSKLNEDQVVYESELLETKFFSNFYRYLRAVRRPSSSTNCTMEKYRSDKFYKQSRIIQFVFSVHIFTERYEFSYHFRVKM